MRVRTDPLTLAVALGLLGPTVLSDDSRLEVHPDDADELVRASAELPTSPVAEDLQVAAPGVETVSYEVDLAGVHLGLGEE
jgi:hypothetical protein